MRILLTLFCLLPVLCVKAQQSFSRIRMERTVCFGQCPAYVIDIRSNGQVLFRGIKHAVYDGTIRGRLPKAEWNKLLAKYKKINWQKLPNQYRIKTHDVSKVHFTVTINGKTKTVRNADEGPEYLMQLCEDLTTLWGKKVIWDKKSFVPNEQRQDQPMFDAPPAVVDEGPAVATVAEPDENEVMTVVEQMPEFPGGQDALMSFIRSELVYPAMAKELGIQGKVICGFVVDQEGMIQDVRLLRGIGHGCDEEAIRVIKKMPRWKPGMQNGRKVKVRFNLPISFKLL